MKFALLFLACFVSLSYQQAYWPQYAPSPYFSPRFFYWPWGYESQYYQQPDSVVVNADHNGDDVQARVGYSGSSSNPQNRFFFQNGLFGFGGNRNNFGTTTVFATSTSTAIVANFLSCIPGVQFSSNPSSQATNPCGRRKRLVAEILDALEEVFDAPETIVPSAVNPVEVTTTPTTIEKPNEPVIESSQEDSPDSVRRERANFNYVTVSSWITTYSFITTNVKRTYTLASSNALQCLPPGFVVC